MSKLNHTPGPWLVERMIEEADGNRYRHIRGADGFYPATVANDSGSETVEQANARLIAAAPDMYALLLRAASGLLIQDEARQLIAELEGK